MYSLISSIFFLLGWTTTTIQVLKKKKNPTNLFVSLFFTIGVFFSTIDQYYKHDLLFVFFATAMAILAFIDFYYVPWVLKIKKEIVKKEEKIFKKSLNILKKE